MRNDTLKYILVAINKVGTWILFEDDFIDKNEFKTQNMIIETLKRLFPRDEFIVELHSKQFKESDK